MVRVAGFEPTASWSRTKHATSCATPGCKFDSLIIIMKKSGCVKRVQDIFANVFKYCRMRLILLILLAPLQGPIIPPVGTFSFVVYRDIIINGSDKWPENKKRC